MMNSKSWLLVANSSNARIFQVQNKSKLDLVRMFDHPESRMRSSELVSDSPGRAFESMGTTRHVMENHHTPQKLEFEAFAKRLAQFLGDARVKGEFQHLYIAANPSLLGLLRDSLDSETTKLISGHVDKDLTQLKPDQIVSHLPFIV